MPGVVVFDLDDTLVRWQAAVRGAVQRLAATEPLDREAFAHAVRRVWYGRADDIWTGRLDLEAVTREATAAVAADLGVDEGEAARLYQRYVGYVDELLVPYEDAEALRALAADYRLGVATNGIGAVQRRKLRRAGLADLFA
ncbi:MAG: HAD family hydrolase, partial [Armatimonadota bacterium]|nr:HAD family hydrolase [Armatimonadota bacterium]